MEMNKNTTLEQIRETILGANTIALSGHTNPDGDAIGACLALAASLSQAGKTVEVFLEDFGDKYLAIPNHQFIVTGTEITNPDLFIALDCGSKDRLGQEALAVYEGARARINFDHHKSNTYFAESNYVIAEASSTSEMMYDLIAGHFPVDDGIAAALYAGICYDTGGFRHSSTSPKTMAITGELMKYDFNFTDIYNQFFDSRSFLEMKGLGKSIENTQALFQGQVIFCTMSTADMESCGVVPKNLDAVVNYLKGVGDCKIACFLYEKAPAEVKASFRCVDGYDVAALAQKFDGGGHVKAAGCTLWMSMDEAVATIKSELERVL